jgi:hypothetical protein
MSRRQEKQQAKYEQAKAAQQEAMEKVPHGSPSARYDQVKAKSQEKIAAAIKKSGGGR